MFVAPMVALLLLTLAVTVVLAWFMAFWLRAMLSGEPVPLAVLIAMRLRGNPPGKLVDAYIALRKQGHAIGLAEVEMTCITRGLRHRSAEEITQTVLQEWEKREP